MSRIKSFNVSDALAKGLFFKTSNTFKESMGVLTNYKINKDLINQHGKIRTPNMMLETDEGEHQIMRSPLDDHYLYYIKDAKRITFFIDGVEHEFVRTADDY